MRLRLLLIVCLTFAAVFAGAWTTSLYVRHIERVRVDARQQALDAETRLDDAHDALIAELHLRRSPGIDLELVQSHAVARESALQGLIRRVGIQDADALLREVLALRRRLEGGLRTECGATLCQTKPRTERGVLDARHGRTARGIAGADACIRQPS